MAQKTQERPSRPTASGVNRSRFRPVAIPPQHVHISILLLLLACASCTTFCQTASAFLVGVSGPASMQQQRRLRLRESSSQLRDKNWDKILAEEIEDENERSSSSSPRKSKIPFDMKYNQRNCQRSQQTFLAIRSSSSSAPAADVYGCDSSSPAANSAVGSNHDEALFWYLGKVAHVSDVSLEQCVARQWPLIQQHAANLRPLDLFSAFTNDCLELWCAPADSEFDVAYNRPSVVFQKMRPDVPGAEQIKSNLVGFQGEVYEGGEEGFRTWRNVVDGSPARPEITGSPASAEEPVASEPQGDILNRPPTDEEMQRLEEMLKGKDINELYEEQERRTKLQKGQ